MQTKFMTITNPDDNRRICTEVCSKKNTSKNSDGEKSKRPDSLKDVVNAKTVNCDTMLNDLWNIKQIYLPFLPQKFHLEWPHKGRCSPSTLFGSAVKIFK